VRPPPIAAKKKPKCSENQKITWKNGQRRKVGKKKLTDYNRGLVHHGKKQARRYQKRRKAKRTTSQFLDTRNMGRAIETTNAGDHGLQMRGKGGKKNKGEIEQMIELRKGSSL